MKHTYQTKVLFLGIFLILLGPCSAYTAEFEEKLPIEEFKKRSAEFLNATDSRFRNAANVPLDDLFVSVVGPEAGPFKLMDRILDVNGKRPKDEWELRNLRGMTTVKVLGSDENERTFQCVAPFAGISVFRTYWIENKCIGDIPSNAKWKEYAVVSLLALRSDLSLSETALLHAQRQGMPDIPLANYCAANVLFQRREFESCLKYTSRATNSGIPEIANALSRLESWALVLSGKQPKPSKDKYFPAAKPGDLFKDYETVNNFEKCPSSVARASQNTRNSYLKKSGSNETKSFASKLHNDLSIDGCVELKKPRPDGLLMGSFGPPITQIEVSTEINVQSVSSHPIWFKRHFTMGFLPFDAQSMKLDRINVEIEEGYFGVSFQPPNFIVVSHAYPEFNRKLFRPDIFNSFSKGERHHLRMIVFDKAFEVLIDEKSVYRAPMGKEIAGLIPVFRAQGIEMDMKGYVLNEISNERAKLEKVDAKGPGMGDIDAKNKDGATPLHVAAEEGNVVRLQALLDAGANVNALDALGRTPAEAANDHDQTASAQLLLNRGAARTLQLISAYGTPGELLDACKKEPGEINKVKGMTALHSAVRRRDHKVLQTLLDQGANPNIKASPMYVSMQPITFAITSRNIPIIEMLIAKGAAIDQKDDSKRSPLDYANAVKGSEELKRVLQKGASSIKPPSPPQGDF